MGGGLQIGGHRNLRRGAGSPGSPCTTHLPALSVGFFFVFFFFCTPRQMTAMDEAATHTCVDCLLHYSLQKACKVWLGDGGKRRNSPLAYKTVRPFRKTKAASVRPFWKDLFSQARGSHNKTDHWKITRGIPPAWAKQTCFCPDTCSSHGWNVGCSVPSGRCNHL